MILYAGRKLVLAIALIVVVLIINFFILRLTPGNPLETQQIVALQAQQGKGLTVSQQQQLAALRSRLGLYFDPAPQAFGQWAGGLIKFDFGNSVISGAPFTEDLVKAGVSSFWLLMLATLFGGGVGIGLGVYAAYRPGSWQDNIIKVLTLVFIALPGWYFIAVLYRLPFFNQWFGGFIYDSPWNNFLPVFAVSVILIALIWGQTRSQVISILKQDYIRTARSKGLLRGQILRRHVLRNSLTPLLSIFGNLLPFLLTSQLLIELLTSWQGLGDFFYDAASQRDYTELMGVFSFLVIFCVLCSYVADLGQVWLDPKLKEQVQGGMRASRLRNEVSAEKASETGWVNKVRKLRLSVVVVIAVLIVASITAFFLGRETASQAVPSPVSTQASQDASTSTIAAKGSNPATDTSSPATPVIAYEQVALPSDAQVLFTETIDKGPRTRIIGAVITRKGFHTIEPPQDVSKSSKQIIVTLSSPTLDLIRTFDNDLQGKGWQLSLKGLAGNQFTYIYTKGDRYIWICGDSFTTQEDGGVYRHLVNHDTKLLGAITASGKVKSEVIAITEGFKLSGKDNIFTDVNEGNM